MISWLDLKKLNHICKISLILGYFFCTLTGGEITLHPDFEEIYEFLKSQGVIVTLYTNGLFVNDDIIKLLKRLPPKAVEVSIYSLSNDVMKSVYGAPRVGSAEIILQNILKLRDAGINVSCKTLASSLSDIEFSNIVSWCRSEKLIHNSSSNITNGYDGVDLSQFRSNYRDLQPIQFLSKSHKSVALPCGTRNYGCAMTSSFRIR